jgi:flavin reductase (DIM6/NTAB) family NADH-FMN oxidoreductase RutF
VNHDPPAISVASNKRHYTNRGIRENRTFSVNIPSVDMIEVTDYCGIVSGSKVDKSVLFTPFYGELGTAPMIEECPLNLECRVLQTVIISSMEAFIGEIVTVYTEERYLSGGLPDIIKINPIIFAMHRDQYFRLGEYLAPAYKIGKKFRLKS